MFAKFEADASPLLATFPVKLTATPAVKDAPEAGDTSVAVRFARAIYVTVAVAEADPPPVVPPPAFERK
jgi:hypothetical protein